MDKKVFNRLYDSLVEQRDNIQEWLETAPVEEKEVRLADLNEKAVQAHLEVLDRSVAKAEDETLGVCTICHDYVEPSRLEVDYTATVCIDHYSDDQRRKLENELELSQKVQKALLPQSIPDLPGLELAAFSQPARIVGGDYFDFVRFKDATPGIIIADVMGKGVAASLLMASLQASLRILVTEEEDPCEVVRRLNHLFCHNINLTKFVTIFIARYDPDSQSLEYCNAGHNPPLVFSKQESRWLDSTSPAIGLVENFQFKSAKIKLQPGDVLLLYTDGVTETRNSEDEEFGLERLTESVEANINRSAPEILAAVRRSVQEFMTAEVLEDDTTIVTAKVVAI